MKDTRWGDEKVEMWVVKTDYKMVNLLEVTRVALWVLMWVVLWEFARVESRV